MPLTVAEKNARRSAWRKANRDKENAYSRRYRAKPGNYEAHLAACRRYHANNRDRILAQQRERYATDGAYRLYKRFHNITDRYGISRAQYERLLDYQFGVCACCRQPETRSKRKRLSVDHDHKTGKVRGLLCSHCNTALGAMEEDPERLRALARYIETHAKVS